VTSGAEHTAEVVRATTGFHCHGASRQPADKIHNAIATKTPTKDNSTSLIQPDKAAHVLAKINSKHENRHRSVPLSFQNKAILPDCSGEGRAIP
jgi:hypothetical protein